MQDIGYEFPRITSTASVKLLRRRPRQVLFSQRPEETRPQFLLDPQLMASVGGLPLAVLHRHFSPRRSGPSHPKDAAQDDAVVVGRPAYPAALWRQQRAHQRPLLVGEVRLFGRDRGGLERPFCAERSPRRASCGPAAGRCGLVRSPPPRPSQEEASSSLRLGHREHQATHLGHRRGDQVEIEIPLLRLASSSAAARRVTTRKAWASRHRVT
jgi:hypothetical protein